jgi:hypothetical protein
MIGRQHHSPPWVVLNSDFLAWARVNAVLDSALTLKK